MDATNLSGRSSGCLLSGGCFQAALFARLLPSIELPQVSGHWQAHGGPGVELLLLHSETTKKSKMHTKDSMH